MDLLDGIDLARITEAANSVETMTGAFVAEIEALRTALMNHITETKDALDKNSGKMDDIEQKGKQLKSAYYELQTKQEVLETGIDLEI